MRPDLFRAAIAKVPFVDVLNTMLDPTLPLTIAEYEEWGNPEDKQYYDYIRSYSPYDNVAPRAISRDAGDRRAERSTSVLLGARQMGRQTSRIEDRFNILLLKTDMGSGHFGPSGRYEAIKEVAFDYAFLLSRIADERSRA